MPTEYTEKLLDPRWQRKRLEVFEFDNWTCVFCGASDVALHAHHTYYVQGREPWEYTSLEIVTACKNCHSLIHSNELDGSPSSPRLDGRSGRWHKYWKARIASVLGATNYDEDEKLADPIASETKDLPRTDSMRCVLRTYRQPD